MPGVGGGSSTGDVPNPDTLAPGASGGASGSNGASAMDASTSIPGIADAAAPACASGELLGADGNCHFIEVLAAWDDARTRCKGRGPGWDLSVIRSSAESDLASQLGFEAWLGAADSANEGSWVWVTDTGPF